MPCLTPKLTACRRWLCAKCCRHVCAPLCV
jgi:hypothetical protein